MEFNFTEDCLVGVEEIDEEHRYLFHLMNQIMESLHGGDGEESQLEHYVERLKEYGTEHFAHEEAYMAQIDDPELHFQKRAHRMFMEKLNGIDAAFLHDAEKHALMEDMLAYLTKWLYKHILGGDTLIGKIRHIVPNEEENPCAFTSQYETGIDFVDDEHRRLFDIVGRAYSLMGMQQGLERYDKIMGVLDELSEYAETHFAHEEEYMKKIKYPKLEQQQRAHSIFLDRMDDRNFAENELDQEEYLEELLDFLFGWLSNHIMRMDKEIAG